MPQSATIMSETQEDQKVAEFLRGPQTKLKDVCIGTKALSARVPHQGWYVFARVVTSGARQVLRLTERMVEDKSGPKAKLNRPETTINLGSIIPHFYLKGLFKDFNTDIAKTTIFCNVIKAYAESKFPKDFAQVSESLRRKIEYAIMSNVIDEFGPRDTRNAANVSTSSQDNNELPKTPPRAGSGRGGSRNLSKGQPAVETTATAAFKKKSAHKRKKSAHKRSLSSTRNDGGSSVNSMSTSSERDRKFAKVSKETEAREVVEKEVAEEQDTGDDSSIFCKEYDTEKSPELEPKDAAKVEVQQSTKLPYIGKKGLFIFYDGDRYHKHDQGQFLGIWCQKLETIHQDDDTKLVHIKYVYQAKVHIINGVERVETKTPATEYASIIGVEPFKIKDVQYALYEAWVQ